MNKIPAKLRCLAVSAQDFVEERIVCNPVDALFSGGRASFTCDAACHVKDGHAGGQSRSGKGSQGRQVTRDAGPKGGGRGEQETGDGDGHLR